jgi:PAS domain S-box-containing protein
MEMGEQRNKRNIRRPEQKSKHQPTDTRDIAKSKISEKMRCESHKRFQSLVETISDFIWEINSDGVYTYCSPQAEKIWGYKPEELLGNSAFGYIKPEYIESYLKMFRALLDDPSPMKRMEATGFLDKTGKIVTLEVSAIPFFDDNGKLLGYRGTSRDITQKKRVENALRESEEKYRLLVENASEVIAVVQDGLIKFINRQGLVSTGYSPEDMVSKPFQEFVQPDDRESVGEVYRKLVEDQQEFSNFEFRFISKGSSTRWAILNAVRIVWEEKPAFLAIITDVTDRKTAQEALEESEAKANALIKYAPTIIYEIDIRGTRFITVNDAMCNISGYTREELLAMNPIELLDVDSRNRFAEMVRSKLNGKKTRGTADFRARKNDGAFIDVTLQATFSLTDPDRVFVIGHDITERKRAEEALKLSEEKYRSVVENASEAIVIAQDGKAKYFNPRLLEITGYSAEDLKSTPFLDFIHPEDRKLVEQRYQRRIQGEVVPTSYEYRVISKDGSTRWMLMNAALVTWEGRPATLNFFTDITEEKKLRDQLTEYAHRITQVQEEERKRIAYELHDDTAQYLAILKMQIGALAKSDKIQSPEVKERLEYLEKDADRAFQDVRRYSHELRPVVLEHMGLRAALEQVAEDINNLNYFTVELIVEGREPGLSEEVKLGYFRIVQEALNNVRKHSKAVKAIIDLKFQQNSLIMKVTDDGIGFNLQETRAKSGKKGSLGLISMQERADLIGARLKIESQPGCGTTIRVEIPLPNQSEVLKNP